MKVSLNQKLVQKQAPATLQLIEMLQMGSLEFQNYISQSVEENPVFDFEAVQFYDSGFIAAGKRRHNDILSVDPSYLMREQPASNSLYDDICIQLYSIHAENNILKTAKLMARHIDHKGYLPWDDYNVFVRNFGEEAAAKALALLQSLSPAGLGARDLSECLCLQLERIPAANELCFQIARKHLELMSKGHFTQISHLCKASIAQVQNACQIISCLDPKPASVYESYDLNEYILPDFVYNSEGDLLLGSFYTPKLSLNLYYQDMMTEESNTELRDYLVQKFKQAEQLVNNIEKRNSTAYKCMMAIIEKQHAFFESKGRNSLVPLTLADIAKASGYSVSTISRFVNNKFIQCPFGTFSLAYFFSSAIECEEKKVSSTDVKGRINSIVFTENKCAPLSDQDIVDTLARDGIRISRRTVAKYRQELGIPGTYARKNY